MAEAEWLRVRGIGRERFAGYVADYLVSVGYAVDRTETTEPVSSHIEGKLGRMNPAVPPAATSLKFRVGPTSGGGALFWESPESVPVEERGRMDRFARELVAAVERAVLTESHGTAKVSRAPEARLPWEAPAATSPSRA